MPIRKRVLKSPHCKYCKFSTQRGGCVKLAERFGLKGLRATPRPRNCYSFKLLEQFEEDYIYIKG